MAVNGAFNVALIALNAARGLIVAAFLTRRDYGVWGVLGLTMMTAFALKNQFSAGDKYVQQDDEDQELAFQRAFTVEAVFAALVAPVAAIVVVVFALFSGHEDVLAPGLLLLLVMPATVLEFPLSTFYRRMDYRRQRTLQAVDPLTTVVVTVGLAVAGAGYWSFVAGLLAGGWMGALVAVRASPYRLRLRYARAVLTEYLSFSTPLLISAMAGIAMFQTIYFVGDRTIGLAGLGAFTLAGNFVQFANQADAIVMQTLYPAVCAVRDRIDLLAEIFVKSNRLSLMWAVPFGVGLSLFCADLFRFVIGPKWLPAAPLLEILGVVTAVNHVGFNWAAFFMARADTKPIAIASVIPVGAFVAGAIPLMYSDGLTGLGWAFGISAATTLVMRAYYLARYFTGFRLQRHLLRAFLPTLVAAGPILLLRARAGTPHDLAGAAVEFLSYVILTLIGTALFERPLLREAIGYLVRRAPRGEPGD